jgi:hypothetical protein
MPVLANGDVAGGANSAASTGTTTQVHEVDAELMGLITDGPFMDILSKPDWWKVRLLSW